MLRILACLLALCLSAGAASAHTFESCEKVEIAVVTQALDGAAELALRASVAIADGADYGRWFGRFSLTQAEEVRANLKAVHDAIQSDGIKAHCGSIEGGECKPDTYAWVYPEDDLVITLCPAFFGQPTMAEYDLTREDMEYGTREGTLIHELSHFKDVAETDDICYGRTPCSDMAQGDARSAIRNADSYQYFSEDVAWAYLLAVEHPVRRGGNLG